MSALGECAVGALTRGAILAGAYCAAYMEHNPVVRLEALLGLSPSPAERVLGVKTVFSGMTEGMHRLARCDVQGSLEANVFAPAMAVVLSYCAIRGRVPKISTTRQERWFFAAVVLCSALVNVVN